MPQLPTITVTDAQATRILDAYKSLFGTTTNAETAQAFRKWLARSVKDVVLAHEAKVLDEAAHVNRQTKLESLSAELPNPDNVTA